MATEHIDTSSRFASQWYHVRQLSYRRLSFASYNVQAIPAHRPLRVVLAMLLFDIIALQSTCEKWGWIQGQPDQLFYRKNIGNSHIISWPRHPNAPDNRVTGVLLALDSRIASSRALPFSQVINASGC